MLVRRNGLVPAPATIGLDRLLNDIFDSFPRTAATDSPTVRLPALNTWEDDKAYHVEVELPGLTEKNVEISVLGNELKVVGNREEEKTTDERNYHRRERHGGSYSRVLRFPTDIDSSKVVASFRNGVLEITLPKAETALPRKIDVKGA